MIGFPKKNKNSIELSEIDRLKERVEHLTHTIETLEKVQKNKDLFFASVNHDIRTPMNAILGLSATLLDSNLEDKCKKQIKHMELSGKHILSLVNDLLDFSKLEDKKLVLEKKEFRLEEMMERVSSIVSFSSFEKKLDFAFDIDNSVPYYIVADSMRLSQILINLLSNAIKFTDKGSVSVNISSSKSIENKLLLEFKVSDTGIGMNKKTQDTIFNAYSQTDASIASKFGGTGLGLSISKNLVNLMGGKIYVESEEGKGSDFRFHILLDAWRGGSDTLDNELKNKNTLIFSTRYKTVTTLRKALEGISHSVYTIDDGENLLSLVREHNIDMIYTHKEQLTNYKNIFHDLKTVKIILLHPLLDIIENYKIFDVEIDADLPKPFTRQMVFNSIAIVYNKTLNTKIKSQANKKVLMPIAGAHILLAEDNTINQTVIKALLENTNIHLSIANNGKDIFPIIEKSKVIDLILMDSNMPIMDGHEAMEALNGLNNTIPVVSFSGDVSIESIKKCKSLGMVDVLSKPIDVEYFYNILLKYIKVQHSFNDRINTAFIDLNSLIERGNYKEILSICRVLKEEVKIKKLLKLENALNHIEDNILNYQKVLFVISGYYTKAFLRLASIVEKINQKELLDEDMKKFLNIENYDKKEYVLVLNNFLNKHKNSDKMLKERIKDWRFESGIELASKINIEASNVGLSSISNAILPMFGVRQAQEKQIYKSIEALR